VNATVGIHERDWGVLIDGLERGNCVALVGPDLLLDGPGGSPRSLTRELSRRLAEILEEEDDVRVQDAENLALVAQVFIDRKARIDLDVEVTAFYREIARELANRRPTAPTFEDLAALPIPLYVTTRHDRTLRHYLEVAGKKPIEKAYNHQGDQERTVKELGSVDAPLIYHLFGSITDPSSLALTEGDLLRLLESIISGNPALPIDLQNHISEKSFLFLGCKLHRDYLRFLLHAIGLSRSNQRSFALDGMADASVNGASARTLRESVLFYQVEYKKLKFLDIGEHAFLHEAQQRWVDRRTRTGPYPIVTQMERQPTERPKAFISYMRRDHDVANRLARSLASTGIEPWIDVRDLRTGTHPDWECSLEDAIGKEVDFFVLVQTEHLADGVETWVHREVELALARKSMRGAVKFLYAIQVDEAAQRLDALDRAHVQAWPLLDFDGDVQALATDMKREFAKLRRP